MLANVRRIFQNVNTIQKRNFYWISKKNNIYLIGLKKQTVENMNGIYYLEINKDSYIRKNNSLCNFESLNLINTIYAPFDCKIVRKNIKILETINTEPESINNSWILKIKPVIWTHPCIEYISSTQQYLNKKKYYCPELETVYS